MNNNENYQPYVDNFQESSVLYLPQGGPFTVQATDGICNSTTQSVSINIVPSKFHNREF